MITSVSQVKGQMYKIELNFYVPAIDVDTEIKMLFESAQENR